MKKLMTLMFCVLLAAALMLPAMASEPKVVLASGAKFTAGNTLTVDIEKMAEMDSRIEAAWNAGTVKYQWYSGNNPIPGATGVSYLLADTDKSVKVVVTCGDLVLSSYSYMITKQIVATTPNTLPTGTTQKQTTSTTKKPTASTTKTPTTVTTMTSTTVSTVPVSVETPPPTDPVAPVENPVAPAMEDGTNLPIPDQFEEDGLNTTFQTMAQTKNTHHEDHSTNMLWLWIMLGLFIVAVPVLTMAASKRRV